MKTLDIRVAFSAVDRLTRPAENARRLMGQFGDSIQRTQGAIKNLERQARSFERARDAVRKADAGIVKARRQLNALNQLQRTGTVLSEKQQKLMQQLSTRLERLNESRTREIQKMRELGGELKRHGISLTGSDNTIQQAIRRTEQYNNQLERERQALARVTRARERYSRAQETAGKLKTGGALAIGAAAAGGYAAGRFLQPAIGFGKEMSRVQALTRIDKNSPQFKALREQALKLGSETQFTASDAASGQSFLAMAGFTPQAIQAALPGVLNMALAGGVELGETADIGSNILTQFNLTADQMDRVGDTLTAAFTRTNTDLRALGETMKYTGPVAAKLGISLEEAAAMAGMLANNGLRGSDAGTAMRASLSRLASPPKAAADALKELGVSVADARGKMRPMEDVLLDLYKATQKYGQVDQVSFFKDIAGEEAFVGLQTLVAAAGSGELQKLTRELQGARGEADRVAKVMADNLDGDLKNLDSAWEGLRIRISDLVDGPLRSVTQWLTRVLEKITSLAQAHPVLTRQLLIAGGALLAMTATIGSLSLVIGVLYGKLATLRLGFDILTRSMNVIRVLPALWGMVTGSVSLLGGAIGALFSPVGLIVAALAGAAVLIWKYWDPIRAFFAGVFSGIMERLTPLRETFERFGPVFDAIGSGISLVFNWFKSLLSPMESSKETLDKCTSAGEVFGNVLGGALQLVLTPAKMLLDTLAWILEKLGVLPDEAERARKKIEDAQRAAILQDKVALLQGDLAKINPPKPVENGNGTGGDKPKDNKPLTDSNTGTLRRLSKIADNTGKLVDETKKRIGPGDIVFKNLPRALAVRGEWQERKIAQVSKPAPAINITPVVSAPLPPALVPVVAASSRPVAEAIRSPVASVPATSRNREPAVSGFCGEIHVHLHNVVTQNPRELAKLVGEMVRAEMERRARAGRGSFYDKD
ncbi:phage tail tape measure protein [Escherichia coli]|jgi:TP901 family phage tail tape measure protein|uniref:Tail protein (Modular protein) n=1 Tax=Escherichia coli O104:H4 (strain 2011C-3493) TaxID=1133852 RepID=A0A0E0XZV5_ECO1C|nr:phage tail tape measure protein [Escherichia coli]EEZ8895700.1 phage tail tape measure protein [Escherichia coli O104]EHF0928842.1 phage tail tape measure protein [Shigella flexneri]HDQ6478748.1 phage tail tape measure protein [Escherichia coli O104:H4 str. 11-3798]HDQ7007801.1 phage tail tape measure protein [Escherichia coli O104:H4 str. Ec11-5537]HDQ7046088.1 phage tail tape measure protein [Escherichia coli O104:H4 str. Ec11-5538]HDR0381922.1 phage tail tape measure protein [Escherichi